MTIRRAAVSVVAGCAAGIALVAGGAGAAQAGAATEAAAAPGMLTLTRYYNGAKHWSTTGEEPGGAYESELKVAILAEKEAGSVPLYACLAGHAPMDQFLSLNAGCEGVKNASLGLQGYVYSSPAPGFTRPIYRCHWAKSQSHFFSLKADCESTGANPVKSDFKLGYVKG
ncbi:hypothetical protein AB0I81_57405 [Nonomuraea sp. NPDC050404]|uniref:hypothetical protein n=1 Tax=Nonomuraea sp. NPDC050404 TaxID=3155783 RepID=UPI0033FE2ED3